MTRDLSGETVAQRIGAAHPDAVVRWDQNDVWVEPSSLLEVARFLRDTPDLDLSYLVSVTAVDYVEDFEVIYHLRSLRRNHGVVLKTRCPGRGEPSLTSVVSVWRGADFQEREVWDLMGIRFEGHPNMKRILLWEEFPGHPLRKDYVG